MNLAHLTGNPVRLSFSILLLSSLLAFLPFVHSAEIEEAEDLLKRKKYTEATNVLTDDVIAKVKKRDYARYLRARTQFFAKNYAGSIKDCEAVPKKSEWYRKALFLKAQNFIALKKHDDVESIYRSESERFSSPERKEKLAQLLVDFADELRELPPNADSISQKDAEKALSLLASALEIKAGPDLRDEILFDRITLLRELKNSEEKLQNACNDYLAKFDNSWSQSLGKGKKRGRKNQYEGQVGKHLWEVRMILLESTATGYQRYAMRRYARKVMDGAPDSGAVEWLITSSYHSDPNSTTKRFHEQLRQFIKKYPQHSRAAEAVFTLAGSLNGKDSIAVYEEFLNRKDWPEPVIEHREKITPEFRLAAWREKASFQIGRIRFAQGDYAGAIKQWQQYSKDFANSSQWASAQAGIVTAEFRSCLDAVYVGDEAEARKRFVAFMTKYPLDKRLPQLLFLRGEFPFARYTKMRLDKKPVDQWRPVAEKAIAEWATLIAKYGRSYEAQLAQYRSGVLQVEALGQFEKGLESLKKTLTGESGAIYNVAAARGAVFAQGATVGNQRLNQRLFGGGGIVGNGGGGNQSVQDEIQDRQVETHSHSIRRLARQRIALLESKSLSLKTDRIFRTNEVAQIRLETRNIKEIIVTQYKLDLERFFRSHHRFDTSDGIEALDIDLIQPDETKVIKIENYSKHRQYENLVPVNFAGDEPGVCIIRAEGDGWQASTIVLRSSIDLITESTWREALVFATDSISHEKIAGARVLVTNGKELIGQGKTDGDGIFRLKGQMIRDSANLFFYVKSEQGEAMKRLNLSGMTQEITAGETEDHYANLSPKGYLYTSKSAYQPGETVHVRGIFRDVKDGEYQVKEDAEIKVKLLGDDHKTAREWDVSLNKFGTFEISFTLPERITGRFIVLAKMKEIGAEEYGLSFKVESQKIEISASEIKLEMESKTVLPGDEIRGKLRARYPGGEPIVNELVSISFPDGREEEFKTNQEGEVDFKQDTVDLQPGQRQSFSAKLVHQDGDADAYVLIQPAAFHIMWKQWPEVALAGEVLKFRLQLSSEYGDPVAQALDMVVEKLPPESEHSVLSGLPTANYRPRPHLPEEVVKNQLTSDAKSGLIETEINLEKPGQYRIIVSGEDAAGNPVRIVRELSVEGHGDDSKLQIFAEGDVAKEGEVLQVKIHSSVASSTALLTIAGTTILETHLLNLKQGYNDFQIPVQAIHWPKMDIAVAFLHDGKLERARRTFEVSRYLKIKVIAPKSPVAPGEEVEFSIKTSDSAGNPVSAEVNLGMSGKMEDHFHRLFEMFRRGERRGAAFRFGSTAAFRFAPQSKFTPPDNGIETGVGQQHAENQIQKIETILSAEKGLCASFPFAVIRPSHLSGAEIISRPLVNQSSDYRWTGPLVTDADGKAAVKIRIPESAGDWKLSVIGCDSGKLFGETSLNIQSAYPLSIVLTPPADIRFGDVWIPEASVRLMGGKEKTITLKSKIGNVISSRNVEIQPGKSHRILFAPYKVTNREPLSWSVSIGNKTFHAGVPVRPGNFPKEGNTAAFAVAQADEITGPDSSAYLAASYYSRPADFLSALAMVDIPKIPGIDREAQTDASSLLAATSALRLGRARKLKSPELEERIRQLILALQVTQKDGGWSWQGVQWQRDSLSTNLALWGLHDAKKLGFYVNESIVAKGIKYLSEVLAIIPPEEPEKTAMVLFALALEDSEDFPVVNRLYRDREKLNPAALAFLAGTFLRMDRLPEAKEVLKTLQAARENDSWPGSQRVARLSNPGDIAAMALWSMAKIDSAETNKIARQLLIRGGAHFGTQSACQGLWIAALANHFLNETEEDTAANAKAILKLNGKEWATLDGENHHAMIFSDAKRNQISFESKKGFLLLTWAETSDTPPKSEDEKAKLLPTIASRNYYPSNLRHGDGYLSSQSTSPVSNVESGKTIRVEIEFTHSETRYPGYLQIDEPIPAGFVYLAGTLSADQAKFEQTGNVLRITTLPGWSGKVSYQLAAVRPGDYFVPPTIVRDECRPLRFNTGKATNLTVLAPGIATQDTYRMNVNERYQLARKLFEKGGFDSALTHLQVIEKDHGKDPAMRKYEREISRMLLWIHTSREELDAKRIVERFEALSERHADLVIPFDKIRKVAEAYKSLGEMERSWLVYRAMIESDFINDSSVAMTLKTQGDFIGYREAQQNLWMEYPDEQDVLLSYFAIAQELEEKSHKIKSLIFRKNQSQPMQKEMLTDSRDILKSYLTHYPDSDQADSAAFSLANVFFDLKDYAKVASYSETAALTYPDSDFLSSFQYMAALGNFWQYQFPQALKSADPVAAGRTENAPNARYIIAQIHQAQGQVSEAITWYRKVRDQFPDARDSLKYLEEKGVKLTEPITFHPGDDISVDLSYRNIREADIQIYKVDLMRLYSRQEKMTNIAKVALAGISPELELSVALGEGNDYQWKDRQLKLPIKEVGAYLLVCRGDSSFASGLVIVTPLELKIREDAASGEIRMHLWDREKKVFVADAEIKTFDRLGSRVQKGHTDPRGAYQADGITGRATVVVKHGDTHYAYYRSANPLLPLPINNGSNNQAQLRREGRTTTPLPTQSRAKPAITGKDAYFMQLKGRLKEGNKAQKEKWSKKLEKGERGGVKASKAFKK